MDIRFLLSEKDVLFFFSSGSGFPWRAFRSVEVEEDRRDREIRMRMETTAVRLVRLPGASAVRRGYLRLAGARGLRNPR